MKPIFSIREMLLMVVIAVLAVGWLMDRYRQESIIKMQQQIEEYQREQLESGNRASKYSNDLLLELGKKIPDAQFGSAVDTVMNRPKFIFPTPTQ